MGTNKKWRSANARQIIWLICVVFSVCIGIWAYMSYAQSGRRVVVSFSPNGGQQSPLYNLEVADDDRLRAKGLMFRKPGDLADNEGMFFAFPEEKKHTFWMKNTYIPLSIAYINEHGQIVSIHDMQPHDVSSVCSLAPAMYALETKQGWYQEQKIKIGDSIRIKQTTSQ